MSQDNSILTVTESALERIRVFRRQGGSDSAAVRITVRPEAPIESKYELEFVAVDSITAEDRSCVQEDVIFCMDARSAVLLRGARIDFKEQMWRSGFLFENPNQLALMADPRALAVQKVLEEQVAPMVASHGGRVFLVDVRDRVAHIQFGGGCQGCGFAPQTLKQGIIEKIRQAVPEILDVIDVTDHAAGEEPYFPARRM